MRLVLAQAHLPRRFDVMMRYASRLSQEAIAEIIRIDFPDGVLSEWRSHSGGQVEGRIGHRRQTTLAGTDQVCRELSPDVAPAWWLIWTNAKPGELLTDLR